MWATSQRISLDFNSINNPISDQQKVIYLLSLTRESTGGVDLEEMLIGY